MLITGESGTGKEEVASAIHRNSPRRDKPFIKVNLGGMSTTLFDSEMFGHVKGAFTDAQKDRTGRLASAHTGTILLDEIGELDPRSQVKLLRVLQDQTYEALGSSATQHLDIRVISATNRDLGAAISEGSFREDLLYRINLITLHLPSLAERPGDIPLLASHFLARAATVVRQGQPPHEDRSRGVTLVAGSGLARKRQTTGTLSGARHPHRRGQCGRHRTCEQVSFMDNATSEHDTLPPVGTMTVDETEKAMIEKSLRHHEGNLSRAAESLGLSRAALYRRLEKYRIET